MLDRMPLARAGGWAALGTALALGLGSVRLVILGRLLGPAELGVAGVALLVLTTAEGLTEPGLESALVSHPGRARGDLAAAFSLQAARGLLLAALIWVIAPAAAGFFAVPQAAAMIRVLALTAAARGLTSPARALVARRGDFRRLFWWGLPGTLIGFAVGVGVALRRPDAWAVVAAAVAGQVAGTIASYGLAPWRPRLRWRGRGAWRLRHYGRWTNGARLLMFLSVWLDNLLVGRLLGTAALGLYQTAFRIGELPVLGFAGPAGQVALPALTAARRRPDEFRRLLRGFLLAAAAPTALFALGALLLGGVLVPAVLGPGWSAIVPLLWILSASSVLRTIVIIGCQAFYALGEPRRALATNAVRMLTLAALLYPLLTRFGLTGVAVAVLASSAVAAVVTALLLDSALGGRARPDPAPKLLNAAVG